MNNFLRTIIAGYGAKKLGGGCFSTILIFVILYWALGTCNSHPVPQRNTSVQTSTHTIAQNNVKNK
ncbi:MAG: hypothetical protein ACR2FN_12710 [Chitinophagaceae bacterium]